MRAIAITGKGSYIGSSFKKMIEKDKDKYVVQEIETKNDEWEKIDFKKYDTVLHVAGIAHVSADPKLKELYFSVNRDLAIKIAKKARDEGVKQFIFMSSMIVYGKDEPIGKKKIIDRDTIPETSDFYGQSKLEADLELQKMQNEDFKVVIIRTPMVYGPNCKGNFPKLKKISKIAPIFPDIENKRSMIYIDNLCEFFKQCINNNYSGIFFPQNREYLSTKQIIKILADSQGKKIHFTKIFNPLIKLFSKKIDIINKVFGNKIYDKNISGDFSYCIVDNEESIRRCV